jgi:hypothetical protein
MVGVPRADAHAVASQTRLTLALACNAKSSATARILACAAMLAIVHQIGAGAIANRVSGSGTGAFTIDARKTISAHAAAGAAVRTIAVGIDALPSAHGISESALTFALVADLVRDAFVAALPAIPRVLR